MILLKVFLAAVLIFASVLLLPACAKAPEVIPEKISAEKLAETPPAEIAPPADKAPPTQKESDLQLVGYLPAASVVSAGSAYNSNLALLTSGILNTAAHWDETGLVQVTEDFAPALKKLASAPSSLQLWCTVNPQGKLVRGGTAGKTINTAEKRTALAKELLRFCEENSFAGIDIDWEFPTEAEWADFSALVVEADRVLGAGGKGLSLAFYPEKAWLTAEATSAVDFVNVMAYDQFDENGDHSSFETAERAVSFFLGQGFLPEQLRLGMPCYGRPTDKSESWPAYSEAKLKGYDDNFLNGIYYNAPSLVKRKTAMAKEKSLGGVMLYHIYLDLPADDEGSLTRAAAEFTTSR